MIDAGSALAPTLQVLLTNMWKGAGGKGGRCSTTTCTGPSSTRGTCSGTCSKRAWRRSAARRTRASGLALDVLEFHTTEFDTAAQRTRAELAARYPHRREKLAGLLRTLKEGYLLIDTEVNGTGSSASSVTRPGWPTTPWPPWSARSSGLGGPRPAGPSVAREPGQGMERRRMRAPARRRRPFHRRIRGGRDAVVDGR